ncbi:hypothetical protein BH09SUM1_BH09SUM1_34020 [soil metagenome]
METQNLSAVVRKPWGGQLEADEESFDPAVMDALGWLGFSLRKFAELSLLATLVAVPMMYQFSISPRAMQELQTELFADSRTEFFVTQLQPYLAGFMPVLESKFSAWFILGTAMGAAYLSARVLEAVFHRRFFPTTETTYQNPQKRRFRMVPLLAIVGYLVYSLASFLFWPPNVPQEAMLLAGGAAKAAKGLASIAERAGGGGFFFSMQSWMQLAFALVFFLVAEDLIRERHFVNKLLGVLLGVGVVNALTVVLLQVRFAPLMEVWVKFGPDEIRNNLGAFVGHNTGVSSFLMAPLLISITWLMGIQPQRRPAFRLLLTLSALLMMLAIVLAQSRAVIPILCVCIPLLVFMLSRRSTLVHRSRLFLWLPVALGLILLTQLVPSSQNPLYRSDISLAERAANFKPTRLLTETRLRILAVCASQLLPERLLFGHGFGTFQYVYAKAQGEYFEDNPRSLLAPTALRTPQAHDDFLQVLVETGVTGLAIVLLGIGFLLRGGWNVLRRTLMPYHVATQVGLFVSILALLAHCAFDFPTRIPPIAISMTVLFAIWSAGDRVWLFPLRPASALEAPPIGDPERRSTISRVAIQLSRRSFATASTIVGGALSLVAIAVVANGAAAAISPFQSWSTLLVRGQLKLDQYRQLDSTQGVSVDSRQNAIADAYDDFRQAQRIYWVSGEANLSKGQAEYYRARLLYQSADAEAKNNQLKTAAGLRDYANQLCSSAINDINMALSEERFHGMYQMRAAIYQLRAQNTLSPKREEFTALFMEDLRRAANMNPGDPATLLQMVRALEGNPIANRTEIVHYMGTMNHYHPDFFRKQVYGRVLDAVALSELEEAVQLFSFVKQAAPDDEDFRIADAVLDVRTGFVDRARQNMEALLRTEAEKKKSALDLDTMAQAVLIEADIASGKLVSAENRLRSERDDLEKMSPNSVAPMLYLLAKKRGDPRATVFGLEKPVLEICQKNPAMYQVTGDMAFKVFHDNQTAIEYLERRRIAPTPGLPMDMLGLVCLAKARAQLGEWDKVRELLPEIDKAKGSPFAKFLTRQITEGMRRQAEEAAAKPAAAP